MTTELAIKPELVILETLPQDQNPAAVYIASLPSKTGRRSQLQALNRIADLATGGAADAASLNWAGLRYQHTAAIRARLIDLYKPATVNKFLSAMRGALKAAWRLGQMTAEEFARASDLKAITGETIPAGRELTQGEILALMGDCEKDPTPAGIRDGAIIAMLYAAGLRREEIINLDLANYDAETGRLLVYGKRAKERTAWLTNGAAAALADWLTVRGSDPGPLFQAVNKGGAIQPGRLTPQAVYNMLAKRAAGAGVKSFSPHDLRRTFVSDLLDAGADIATVSKMAGHANVQTTARYDRRPEQAKAKAAGLLHVPYNRRRG